MDNPQWGDDPFEQDDDDAEMGEAAQLFLASSLFEPLTLPAIEGPAGIEVKQCPVHIDALSPAGLLYVATYRGHLECLLPPVERRRVGGKQASPINEELYRLQLDPGKGSSYIGRGKPFERAHLAHRHYLAWLARHRGVSQRTVRVTMSRAEFGALPQCVINA